MNSTSISRIIDRTVSAVLGLLILCWAASSQSINNPSGIESETTTKTILSPEDIRDTIASFRTHDVEKQVKKFRANLPKQKNDIRVQKAARKKVYKDFGKLKVENKDLTNRIREIIKPVLGLYGKESSYQLFVFEHRNPYVANQSGIFLILTTGLLAEIRSDDELLGFIAHEIGHDYFAEYSKYSEHLFLTIRERSAEKALLRHFAKILAILELQCDAFAAITMKYLGYSPVAFSIAAQRMSKKYPVDPAAYHPTSQNRRDVVSNLFEGKTNKETHRLSDKLKRVKHLVANLE